jgi:hypothetical protein
MVPTIPADTDPETAAIQLEMLRRAGPERRLSLALSLSRSVIELARAGLRQRRPGARPEEIGLRFAELHYGSALAAGLASRLPRGGA